MGGCVCLIQQSNCTQRFSVCFGWQCASQSVFRNARQPESVCCSVQDSNGQEGRNARKTNFTVRLNAGTAREGASLTHSRTYRKTPRSALQGTLRDKAVQRL